MKSSKILLNLCSFFCFVYFAFYIFTLVFIPLGIYCFLAGKTFNYKSEHLDETIVISNQRFKMYVIIASILCFPFGLLSIIPYLQLTSNNIIVRSVNDDSTRNSGTMSSGSDSNDYGLRIAKEENVTEAKEDESYADKMEKFKKLESFRNSGFITDEELEQAREQIFGKKE